MTTMESLLQAMLAASDERKEAAIKVLRGDVDPPAKPVTGPLLMGMGHGARFLGVSRATLWRILQAGTISKVELFSGSFRIRRNDLEDLAAGKFGAVTARGKSSSPSTNSRLHKMLAGGARKRNPRFQELVALADKGDESAVSELLKEFGYKYSPHSPQSVP